MEDPDVIQDLRNVGNLNVGSTQYNMFLVECLFLNEELKCS